MPDVVTFLTFKDFLNFREETDIAPGSLKNRVGEF